MERQDPKILTVYNKTRSWVSTMLGIIIAVVGIGVVIVISSLEGTKEVKASNHDSGLILKQWREINQKDDTTFPLEKVDIITFKGKEYYFIIDEINEDTGDFTWYFAYDGGIGYVFNDYKYYVLTSIVIVVAVYVSYVNYVSTIRNGRETPSFKKTLIYYQEKKDMVAKHTQYIPDFCTYKNTQAYEMATRDIVEEAGINYIYYKSDNFDLDNLESWQKKILQKIQKIKIVKLSPADLLQERGKQTSKITFLPMSQEEHQRKFMISGAVQKVVNSALSGLVISFGVELGNWSLGLSYGFVVIVSAVSATIIAIDFVNTTLRNRYLAKADLLNEFFNLKEKFIKEHKELMQSPVEDCTNKKENDIISVGGEDNE